MLRRFTHLMSVAALLLLFIPVVRGQVNTASLSGLVTDQTNAALVRAQVTVTNSGTGYERQTETDAAGYYSFPDLPIGDYKVSVSMTNFQTVETRVTVGTSEKVRRDLTLKVGTAETNVQVEEVVNNLSLDDASIGAVIDNQIIQETPLYLRNWDDLLRMVAGVQVSRYTQQSGATSAGRVGDFNVHGVHSLQNNFILDGIDNNTISENVQELSTEASHPSVDTIQEFSVVTNPYSAEYGRSPGAAVSINTKGGSNTFHGTAYEYLRNQFFDANDFISNSHNLSKPENNQNQFGGNFGGPILKNRLFGFFDYEGTRIKQGVSRVSTVPLPNERIGDFSPETAAALGLPAYPVVYDLTTGAPFADNKIPTNRIDNAVSQLMNLFPLPNASGDLNNFVRNALATDNDDSYDARVDYTMSQKNSLFSRFSYSNRSRFIPGFLGGIADGTSTSAWGRQTLKAYSFVLGWTHIFTPTLVSDSRFGFIRNFSYAQQDPFGKNAADEFVPGIPNNPAIAGGVPLTQFSNFGFIGSPDFLPKRQIPQQYQWSETISWTHGEHTFKFGGTLWAPMRNIFQDEPGTRGDLGFTGVFTTCHVGPLTPACTGKTGLSYADGLLGLTQSTQLTNVFFVDQRLWMLAGFAQDDWKVTRKLTLNLGLRYDFATPALEGKNRMANFDPSNGGSLVFAKDGSLDQRALVQVNKKNFGPRLGFAYAIDPKTVIRGGYGIYYSLFERIGSEDQLALNPPFLVNKTLASNTTPVLTPAIGFPANFLDATTIDFNNLQSFHIRAMNPDDPTPMIQQWSLGVQRQIGNAWLAELNYVGTRSNHLDVLSDFNQPIITNGLAATTQPYTNFGYVEYTSPIGTGKYNGLEGTLSRRFTSGLSLRLAYTYSRSLDNTPQELESNSGAAPNGRNLAAWYGPSDFDVPHRVAVSYLYQLPFGYGRRYVNSGIVSKIVGGFETSGVYTYYSGHPFTVNEGGALASALDPFGQATAVPNVVGHPEIVGDPTCWFYVSGNSACKKLEPSLTDAFQVTTTGVVGNSGRNTLRGPHTNVFDFSLTRDFPIKESLKLQFRWEVFNLFNTVLFGQPNGNVTSGAAGQITTLSGDPRVMQFALRLSF